MLTVFDKQQSKVIQYSVDYLQSLQKKPAFITRNSEDFKSLSLICIGERKKRNYNQFVQGIESYNSLNRVLKDYPAELLRKLIKLKPSFRKSHIVCS
jgi:hypothetical protein